MIGAEKDAIVDREGVLETAKYFGLGDPVIIHGACHDLMLTEMARQETLAVVDTFLAEP